MTILAKVDKSAKVEIMKEVLTDFCTYAGIGETDLKSMHMGVELMDKSLGYMAEGNDIKRHPIDGVYLFEGMKGVNEDTSRIILEHHERSDGSGYPFGLKDSQIGRLSKIVAICEEYVDTRLQSRKNETVKRLSSMKGYLNEKLLTKFLIFLMDYDEPLILMLSH